MEEKNNVEAYLDNGEINENRAHETIERIKKFSALPNNDVSTYLDRIEKEMSVISKGI